MHIECPTEEDLLEGLGHATGWLRTELTSKAAPSRAGVRRRSRPIEVDPTRVEKLAADIGEISQDPSLSDGQRIARLLISVADSAAIYSTRAEHSSKAQELLDESAVLLVAVMTRTRLENTDACDLGILEQGSYDVYLYYIRQRAMPTRERSLARACEATLGRMLRAGSTRRSAPRNRPAAGGTAICGIGTPVTRVSDVEQVESLRHAEPVERAIGDAFWLPDLPGRDIVPSMISLAHAEGRDEESESTLMSYAAFVGVDGDRCALGMGIAVRAVETWGCPVLVFGSHPAGDRLTRVFSGSMNGRWTRPMNDDADYLYTTTRDFLEAKRPVILARAEFLAAAVTMPAGPLRAFHDQVVAADPFAFDATALTHRRAVFLTSSTLHWAHAQDHEMRALDELGLQPVPRHPGDTWQGAERHGNQNPRREPVRRNRTDAGPGDRAAGIHIDAPSFQTLSGVARIQGWNDTQVLHLIGRALEPDMALSRNTGVIQSKDWLGIAQQEGYTIR